MSNDNDILVEVNGIGKKFSRNLRLSLFYGLKDVFSSIFGMGARARSTLRKQEFWAVRNVSFTLRRGECLALVGHNGAGKSTLLKMLNGLIRPDEGTITMRGRVGALIELGTGFNPLLSGRENIYLNGMILGFTRAEIDAKLQAIIDFSEIHEFIDSPVQSYSSGMKVRLGFAVAAQMDPDVLIIDEVLAVGDVGFRGKCMKVISEMMNRAAVIFVSHSMPIVNRYCNRGILLNRGVITCQSDNIGEVISKYLEGFDSTDNSKRYDSGEIELMRLACNETELDKGKAMIPFNGQAHFDFTIRRKKENVDKALVKINFIDRNLVIVASVFSEQMSVNEDVLQFRIDVGPVNLQPGAYKLFVNIYSEFVSAPMILLDSVYTVQVEGEENFGANAVVLGASTVRLGAPKVAGQ